MSCTYHTCMRSTGIHNNPIYIHTYWISYEPYFSLHFIFSGFEIHEHRPRSLPTVHHCCVPSISSQIYPVDVSNLSVFPHPPLAVLSLVRPRHILPFVYNAYVYISIALCGHLRSRGGYQPAVAEPPLHSSSSSSSRVYC